MNYTCIIVFLAFITNFSKMKPIYKLYTILLISFLTGCGLSMPKFENDDNDINLNSPSYEIVLEKNYSGYEDDNNLSEAEIDSGAKNFVKCANSTECGLLWDTAKTWITEKSTYSGELKINSMHLLETKADPRKSKADKITFKVLRLPKGEMNIIKIEAECPKNCKNYINKEYFAFNSYLKNHLLAYKNNIIGYAEIKDDMIISSNNSDNLDINFDNLSDDPQESVLEKNELLEKIEVTKTNKKKYIGKVAESLIDKHSCHKASEINLVKKTMKRELYEVNCIKEVKRMIFDCSPDGCKVLQ